MKKHFVNFLLAVASVMLPAAMSAQTPSASDYLQARSIPAKTLFYNFGDAGTLMPKINWGLDQAWISETNMLQGRNYLNLFKNNVNTVRISFQPCWPYPGTALTDSLKKYLDKRIANAKLLGYATNVYLNSDPMGLDGAEATVNSDYSSFTNTQLSRWVTLMKLTGQYVESQVANDNNNFSVVAVAPYNEPDYSGWKQGTASNLKNVMSKAKADSWFSGKRMVGPNTLNVDKFSTWYNTISGYTDEVNSHMLAGTFSNYVSFLSTSKTYKCQDEMHNVMDAMMGANYGMTTGIWWGTAEHARSQFCRASDGTGYRLAYLENSDAFMAGSVYRNTQDDVTEAFFGASERTATSSSFGLVSKDRDVYYDGYGPTRAYYVNMPADPSGTYQSSLQRNAETVIKIHSGADVPPAPVDGTWQIMNVGTGKALTGNASWTGWSANKASLKAGTGADGQGWVITAVQDTIGGDFSYHTIYQNNGQWWNYYLDDNNWSFEEANEMIMYPGGGSGCEQWWFEYAGDGGYYIHNRYTNLVLEASSSNTVMQKTLVKGTANQIWKLCNASVTLDQTAPAAPSNLKATPLPAAISLSWTASGDADVTGYTILRCTKGQDDWNTIARNVGTTMYIDNTAVQGSTYTYKVKAVDKCVNYSAFTSTVDAAPTAAKGLIARYEFDGSARDKTDNQMGAALTSATFTTSNKSGGKALTLGGSDYVQLPYQIANVPAFTFTGWVYWNGGDSWQRIFDLGNGEDEYMFLTPSNGSAMRYEIKKDGTTQGITLSSKLSTGKWVHVAVTTESGKTCVYVDGTLSGSSTEITILPSDIQGVCNYLGRSQFTSDPLLNANLDDVRFYNYALSASEISTLANSAVVSDTPVEWSAGGSYYIYNVEAGQFLCAGNAWGTQASLSTTGIPWTINSEGSGLYSLSRTSNTDTYLFKASDTEMYVDGASDKERSLTMSQDATTGLTTIGMSSTSGTLIGWNANTSLTTVMPLLGKNHGKCGVEWILMEEATYNKYQATIKADSAARRQLLPYYQAAVASDLDCNLRTLYENIAATSTQLTNLQATALRTMRTLATETATPKNPIDMSYLMADANCDDTSNTGWTTSGAWSSAGTFFYNEDAILSNRFIEKWVNGWNGETLENTSISQQVDNLPAGRYRLALDIIVTNQGNASLTITGATLYAITNEVEVSTACSTANGVPQCFTTPFTVSTTGNSAKLGFMLKNTNASWVAFDNFRLLYLGSAPIGDVNNDGDVTLADLTHLVNILLGNEEDTTGLADINEDDSVDKQDVSALLTILLNK